MRPGCRPRRRPASGWVRTGWRSSCSSEGTSRRTRLAASRTGSAVPFPAATRWWRGNPRLSGQPASTYGCGTRSWRSTWTGGVFGVQTLDDGTAIHAWLDRDPKPRKAVVIGGGYIGVEMAEAMVRRGLDVKLLEKSAQPLSTVDPDMGERVAGAIRGLGIEIRTNAHAQGLETVDGRVRAVVTPDGALPADIVVLGLGVRPNTALAAE